MATLTPPAKTYTKWRVRQRRRFSTEQESQAWGPTAFHPRTDRVVDRKPWAATRTWYFATEEEGRVFLDGLAREVRADFRASVGRFRDDRSDGGIHPGTILPAIPERISAGTHRTIYDRHELQGKPGDLVPVGDARSVCEKVGKIRARMFFGNPVWPLVLERHEADPDCLAFLKHEGIDYKILPSSAP